jgi:hypothetical protein
MLDFFEVSALREDFLMSLFSWRNRGKLYSSIPRSENTSFTCSAYVAMSFLDSGETLLAQQLAISLKSNIEISQSFVLLNETRSHSHIEANARSLSAILRCCPFLFDDLSISGNAQWIMTRQNDDGSWDLYHPNSSSLGKVIWTCSALDALLKYFLLSKKISTPNQDIKRCIERGINYLLINLSDSKLPGSNLRPCLWSIDGHDNTSTSRVFDMNVSVMCFDIIAQALNAFDGELNSHKEKVVHGLCDLLESQNEGFSIQNRNNLIGVWTVLQEHSPHSYSRTFFAPGCLPHILSHLPIIPPERLDVVRTFSEVYVNWIVKNTITYRDGGKAVRSSQGNASATVWATAQAVSALSAVLNHRYVFEPITSPEYAAKILLEQPTARLYAHEQAKKLASLIAFILAIGISIVIVFIGIIYIIPNWNNVEPITWIFAVIVGIVAFFLPIAAPRLADAQWGKKIFFRRLESRVFHCLETAIRSIAKSE